MRRSQKVLRSALGHVERILKRRLQFVVFADGVFQLADLHLIGGAQLSIVLDRVSHMIKELIHFVGVVAAQPPRENDALHVDDFEQVRLADHPYCSPASPPGRHSSTESRRRERSMLVRVTA